MRTLILASALSLMYAGPVSAKGGLQLQGTITELDTQGDELSFVFTGKVALTTPTASSEEVAPTWQSMEWQVAQLPIRIAQWTVSADAAATTDQDTFQDVVKHLSHLVIVGHAMAASIDHPTLAFSNLGELLLIEGSRIHVADLTTLTPQPTATPPTSQPPADRKSKKKSP